MKQRIARHIGNRGAVLIVLGSLWLLTAVGIATQPVTQLGRLLPYEYLPVPLRIALWAFPGLVAVGSGLTRRWDVSAWTLLIVPVTERAISFAFAWGITLFNDHYYPGAWRGFLVYAATGTLIYFCARGLDQTPRSESWGAR